MPRLPLALALISLIPGCALNSRDRLASCEQRVQTLSAETVQLRQETLTLRNRNRDLAQRAVDDARRLRDAELTARRLEQSLASYQTERKEIARAFQDLQNQVLMQAQADRAGPQAQVEPTPNFTRPDPTRFAAFARAQPGARFDPARASWFFPADSLFSPGSDQLTPRASLLLDAFARLLDDPSDPARPTLVTCLAPDDSITRTSGGDPPPNLALARARQVRLELARRLGLDPNSIPATTQSLDPAADNLPDLRGVEIELASAPASP